MPSGSLHQLFNGIVMSWLWCRRIDSQSGAGGGTAAFTANAPLIDGPGAPLRVTDAIRARTTNGRKEDV